MEIRKWMFFSAATIAVAFVLTDCSDSSLDSVSEKTETSGAQPANHTARNVTPVRGASWIHHLGIRNISQTAMGQMGGLEPALPSKRREPGLAETDMNEGRRSMGGMMGRIFSNYRSNQNEVKRFMDETFLLSGSDLFRLNCQSCHGPNGTGKQPEIHSLIGPVQGTSPAFVKNWGEKLRQAIDPEMAQELVAQAVADLRGRLNNGGEKMPAFRHLEGKETDALIAYLQVLAGVSSDENPGKPVTESVARVGEHLVKGTCHICHDATGPGSGHMMMMRGIIPSLASFPDEKTMQDVVRQVESGSMPMMSMMGGEVMPAYPYVTEDEGSAAYLFLVRYPPEP